MVSIIVTVYNVESYLPRCLDSIAAQTYTDIGVILVDDGSTDASGRICDDFCRTDGRFRVIHTENRGVSAARNTGLEESSGEWIYIADADDYLHPRMLELLLAAVSSGYDVAECGFRTSYSDKREAFAFPEDGTELPSLREISPAECLLGVFSVDMTENLACTVLWNKLYSRKVLEGLSFEHHIMEDAFLNFEIFRRTPEIVYLDAALYSYHQRGDGYSHCMPPEHYAVELLRQTITLMDRTSGMDSATRGAALSRTYRKMLTARYLTRRTGMSAVAREMSAEVLSGTGREYFRSSGISMKEKAMFGVLWSFPFVHSFMMKRLGN